MSTIYSSFFTFYSYSSCVLCSKVSSTIFQ
uniref:Uncharacterized protein n=1 Tax=Myoviridae sp. ctjhW4 TaxID=2825162 RepID=A0A8S5PT90_9CAUD|nr:MAG TPA: hypothetical protein [Myoviridae sp. ctjhW4]